MGLLINQGRQILMDNTPIEEENVLCKISDIAIHPRFDKALEVTFTVMGEGQNKGRKFKDTINYDPTSSMVWKYQQLRKSVKQPYSVTEPAQIDIEKILLGKVLLVDLGKRLDKEDREWQTCKYKPLPEQANVTTPGVAPAGATQIKTTDVVLPWKEGEDNGDLPF